MATYSKHPRRDEIKMLERRRAVSAFYLMGKTQWEIVLLIRDDYPGITQKTISTDIEWIEQQWLNGIKETVDKRKSIELAKINNLELLAMEGYSKSLQGITTNRKVSELHPTENPLKKKAGSPFKYQDKKKKFPKIKETACDADEEEEMQLMKRTVEESHKGSSGDPRFLTQIQWCVEMRLALFGIKTGEVNNVNNILHIDFDAMMKRNTANEVNPLQNALHELDAIPVGSMRVLPPPDQLARAINGTEHLEEEKPEEVTLEVVEQEEKNVHQQLQDLIK